MAKLKVLFLLKNLSLYTVFLLGTGQNCSKTNLHKDDFAWGFNFARILFCTMNNSDSKLNYKK